MELYEEIENPTVEGILSNTEGIVEIWGVRGFMTPKRFIEPPYDRSRNLFKYIPYNKKEYKEILDEIDWDNMKDPQSNEPHPLVSVELHHNKEFDLSNERDRFILEWLLKCNRALALSKEEADSNPSVNYYVYQADYTARREEIRFDMIDEAIIKLKEIPEQTMRSLGRVLQGKDYDSLTISEMRMDLRKSIEASKSVNPIRNAFFYKFLEKLGSTKLNEEAFFKEAWDKRVIKQDKETKLFKYGETVLGQNSLEAMRNLYDPSNVDLLKEIASRCRGNRPINVNVVFPEDEEKQKAVETREFNIEQKDSKETQEKTSSKRSSPGRPKKS